MMYNIFKWLCRASHPDKEKWKKNGRIKNRLDLPCEHIYSNETVGFSPILFAHFTIMLYSIQYTLYTRCALYTYVYELYTHRWKRRS